MPTFTKILYLSICLFTLSFGVQSSYAKRKSVDIYESSAYFSAKVEIDKILSKDLQSKGLKPTYLASDEVFLRRIYLDLAGRTPTAREVYTFKDNKAKNKRAIIIDELLASDEFALFMTFRWSDIFKIKAEFPINLWPNAAQAYNKYFLDSLRENKAYDKIAYELLTASGSNFRVGSVNFYRALQGRGTDMIADAFCAAFMGIDFTKLDEETSTDLQKFFTKVAYKATKEWKEEIVYNNFANRDKIDTSFFGKPVYIDEDTDPRIPLAKALIENEYFAKNFVNRAFGRLMGNYIIDPDDILNGENLNPKLLDYLANFFVENNYDIKKLYREILNSNAYQQSSIPLEEDKDSAQNFACYTPRQIEAEVFIDIICSITDTAEVYSSMIPEPYTAMPMYIRAISIPDGSITTGFLDLFGKAQRDTGKELERKSRPSASQRMHLLNSSHIRNKIEYFANNFNSIRSETFDNAIRYIYITILSRQESDMEKERIIAYRKSGDKKDGLKILFTDLIWALLNSEEFINKH